VKNVWRKDNRVCSVVLDTLYRAIFWQLRLRESTSTNLAEVKVPWNGKKQFRTRHN